MKSNLNAHKVDELAIDSWYNSLQCKTILNGFNENDLEIKKNQQWVLIKTQIDRNEISYLENNSQPFVKPIFYYFSRVAATIALIAFSYYSYLFISQKPENVSQYVTLTNNTNQATKIILPDNSLLFLKSKSAVKYPKHFTTVRKVFLLSGSVFFNIAHNPKKPFIVETGNGVNTKVLGTAFVIEKILSNNTIKVSVLRGKVQVSDNVKNYATLTKNQGVNLDIKSKTLLNVKADSLQMTSWFNTKVVLENVTLKEVAASVNKNLGYKIEFSNSKLLNKPCTITYNTTDNIDNILLLLDKIYHTSHEFSDNGTVYIKSVQF